MTVYGLAAEFNAERDLVTFEACERELRARYGDDLWSDSQEQLLHRLPLVGDDGRPTVRVALHRAHRRRAPRLRPDREALRARRIGASCSCARTPSRSRKPAASAPRSSRPAGCRRCFRTDPAGGELVISKRTLLFAPCAFNLAETSRMVEIAKGIRRHPTAARVFDLQFISNGGDFESLIEKHGFPLTRMEPRLTKEKIEFIAQVDRGEKFAPAVTDPRLVHPSTTRSPISSSVCSSRTGSYLTIPVTCRVLEIPLVWVMQSTWLPQFFLHGAGTTDLSSSPLKIDRRLVRLGGSSIFGLIRVFGTRQSHPKHHGVPDYSSIFEFWRGDITLVAEQTQSPAPPCLPITFSSASRPGGRVSHAARSRRDPADEPLIYFAMGSSGTPNVVPTIFASFKENRFASSLP